MPSFTDRLAAGTLVADGATGTNYQRLGIAPGVAPEEWVFDEPEQVQELHRRFVAAGAQLILTCTFGGSSLRLADERLAGRADELNRRAAELAREAAGDGVLVAGSIGPTGHLTEPLGPLTHDLAVETFSQQAHALAAGGVDVLVLETFFSLDEGLWALEGIRRVTDLPVVVSYSFDQGTRTMMGLTPAQVVEAFAPLAVAAVGANCGKSLDETDAIVDELLAVAGDLPLWVKPNAGVPRIVGEDVVYDAGPEDMARHAAAYVAKGVRVVGGCCGTTPEHLAAIAAAVS
ncbi:MAG TPA: homocysteine S-methyltransferase family protein [Gaiellaceae bacterium]|nr:homocysteine S-methyltransferase family protein [Gaiellaceae bacterium]